MVATFLMKAECLICQCLSSLMLSDTAESSPALNVVQHEDRLIHYPLTGEACG